jgi:hypothetical protein
MLAVDTLNLFSPPQETESIGNKAAGKTEVVLTSDNAVATFIGVRWDGDKVRGIRVELSDGSFKQAGGYDDTKYTLTQYHFAADETLITADLRDSGYGYGSLRQVQFQTSLKNTFTAGAGGFDHEASLAVEGSELVGFHAWVNPDNFINALAFIVRLPPPKPVVHRPWFATRSVGNQAAGGSEVELASDTSVARVFSVRWDGDKVRGIRMELQDGTIKSAGGIDDVNYTLSTYTFVQGETLKSLSFSSSGYGYGSLRRLEFTTSTGATFTAGPGGIDDLVTAPVLGAQLVGFHVWVNQDNFINAITFHATNDEPYVVTLVNLSPWACACANGVVTIDGKNVIQVIDAGNDKHGMNTSHSRVVQVRSGDVSGYCAYDGSAQLTISVFGDATFEAKFSVDDGDGVVYGPIAGVKPPADKWALMDALVRKYAPIYMLNVDEVYWQSTIDAFLPNMILQKANASGNDLSTFYDGPMDRNVLAKQAAALTLAGANTNATAFLRTRADLNKPSDTQDWFNSTRPTNPAQVTAYAVVVEGAQQRLDIVYWWFFNYNQGKTVAGTSWGNHVSDWEHVRVKLGQVDFTKPQNESVVGVMYDHHGDQDNFKPGDGNTEFSGRQVLVHLANGDHEAYAKAGVYDRSMGTHDYCKDNAYRFDQRQGTVEIYLWNGSGFSPAPSGATPAFKDSAWLTYRGRWGNAQRGDLLGEVAVLESGPEGILRPSEYPAPLPLA